MNFFKQKLFNLKKLKLIMVYKDNKKANLFSEKIKSIVFQSDIEYFKYFDKTVTRKNSKVLDIGCGDGSDIKILSEKYNSLNFIGIDNSSALLKKAEFLNANNPKTEILFHDFENKFSFNDKSFQIIISKWSLQNAKSIDFIYQECFRMLDDEGIILFLVNHPFRQFLEKKNSKNENNYFLQETVTFVVFDTLKLNEPSHTLQDYLSSYFLKNFDLLSLQEGVSYEDEKINVDVIPTYLLIHAKKRSIIFVIFFILYLLKKFLMFLNFIIF